MLINKSKKIILTNNVKICASFFSKLKGLMFTRKLTDKSLIFILSKEQRIDLHMFFVFYPIDLIFLDKNKRVIEIKKNFRPFTLYSSKNKVKYVVELPSVIIGDSKTSVGDILDF